MVHLTQMDMHSKPASEWTWSGEDNLRRQLIGVHLNAARVFRLESHNLFQQWSAIGIPRLLRKLQRLRLFKNGGRAISKEEFKAAYSS